jgi:hypothetical protein
MNATKIMLPNGASGGGLMSDAQVGRFLRRKRLSADIDKLTTNRMLTFNSLGAVSTCFVFWFLQ